MSVFLDTSVLLSASISDRGASRYVINHSSVHNWSLFSSYYCYEETNRNLHELGEVALSYFYQSIETKVTWQPDVIVSDNIVVFPKIKDKPVLLSAFGCRADVLLTLDRKDFQKKLGEQFYGMSIRTPGCWLLELREQGLLAE